MDIDTAIIECYKDFCQRHRTSSDKIATQEDKRLAFAALINGKTGQAADPMAIAIRTIDLRKRGDLPKAWNGHGKKKRVKP